MVIGNKPLVWQTSCGVSRLPAGATSRPIVAIAIKKSHNNAQHQLDQQYFPMTAAILCSPHTTFKGRSRTFEAVCGERKQTGRCIEQTEKLSRALALYNAPQILYRTDRRVFFSGYSGFPPPLQNGNCNCPQNLKMKILISLLTIVANWL